MRKSSKRIRPEQAFNAGGDAMSTIFKPIKETDASVFQIQSNSNELTIEIPSQNFDEEQENEVMNVGEMEDDKFTAPSTPQLIKGGRLKEDENFHDQFDCSERDCAVEDRELSEMLKRIISETKFVDNTCNNITVAVNSDKVLPSKEEKATAEESKADERSSAKEISSDFFSTENVEKEDSDLEKLTKKRPSNSNGIRGSRRKMKVRCLWTEIT